MRERRLDLDPAVLVAADFMDLAHRMLGSEQGRHWLIDAAPATGHATARDRRPEKILDPADGWSRLRATSWGDRLTSLWEERARALEDFTDRLRAAGTADETAAPQSILGSVLHMHHNRVYGIDRAHERRVLALAANASRVGAGRHGTSSGKDEAT
jgi:thiopeptide-type bacteriocin biosynthesis protein